MRFYDTTPMLDIKKIVMTFIAILLSVSGTNVFAQCMQNCIVLEYNESADKKPLGGVEILVFNAGSTISDEKGKATLKFRTMKPGDKVTIRRIEKNEYEIFNKDALKQWYIMKEGTFRIIMCRSDRFKKIRDNYMAISSASYAKQKKAKETELQNLKKQGKLKKAEYEQKLARLEKEYEQRELNINEYIDRFARIDLSELSEDEQKAIKLFQEGNIDDAIKAYEDMKLEERYLQSVKNYTKTQQASDSITSIRKQHEEMRDSIKSSIKRRDKIRNSIK